MIKIIKKLPIIRKWVRKLNNQNARTEWVSQQLQTIPKGSVLLDAGCGSQKFRKFCAHLEYKGQDFGQYVSDKKKTIGSEGEGSEVKGGYKYGELDYVGDIWNIKEVDNSFDAILCTEVFEHIPLPNETIKEFSRLLKPGGVLILTAPNACLRHMDPYFFYSGFSDRWYEKFLTDNGFEIQEISPVGDYYSWLGVEMVRTGLKHSIIAKIMLFPASIYFLSKKKTKVSTDTLCVGYHVLAKKHMQ